SRADAARTRHCRKPTSRPFPGNGERHSACLGGERETVAEQRRYPLRATDAHRTELSAETTPLGDALVRIAEFLLYEDPVLPELGFLTPAQLRFLWGIHDGGEITLKEAGKRL